MEYNFLYYWCESALMLRKIWFLKVKQNNSGEHIDAPVASFTPDILGTHISRGILNIVFSASLIHDFSPIKYHCALGIWRFQSDTIDSEKYGTQNVRIKNSLRFRNWKKVGESDGPGHLGKVRVHSSFLPPKLHVQPNFAVWSARVVRDSKTLQNVSMMSEMSNLISFTWIHELARSGDPPRNFDFAALLLIGTVHQYSSK
jgi:hypothetical protein